MAKLIQSFGGFTTFDVFSPPDHIPQIIRSWIREGPRGPAPGRFTSNTDGSITVPSGFTGLNFYGPGVFIEPPSIVNGTVGIYIPGSSVIRPNTTGIIQENYLTSTNLTAGNYLRIAKYPYWTDGSNITATFLRLNFSVGTAPSGGSATLDVVKGSSLTSILTSQLSITTGTKTVTDVTLFNNVWNSGEDLYWYIVTVSSSDLWNIELTFLPS